MIFENKKQKNKKNYIIFLDKIFDIERSVKYDEEFYIYYLLCCSIIDWSMSYYSNNNLYNLETNINYKELWILINKYEKIEEKPEKAELEILKWASIQYKGDLTPEEKENFFYERLCLGWLGLEKCLEFLKELEKLEPNYKSGVDIDKINEEIKSIRLKNKYIMDILYIIYYYKNEDFAFSKKYRLFKILTYFSRFMNNFLVYKKLILYKNIKKILKKVKDI